jgi:colanic acid/amylovoran biosynthesis protein
MKYVKSADVVIQFDGDIWGDNADFIGSDRFMVGLLKSITMQNLNENIYMIAGSPGPFDKYSSILPIIKKVYGNFKMVTNRESISTEKLTNLQFPLNNTKTLPCPSFLFKSNTPIKQTELILENENLFNIHKNDEINLIGFVLCGWNMPCGPYNKEKREDDEFEEFVKFTKFILDNYQNTHIVFISHNNAFEKDPFKLKRGRDFKIVSQLYSILKLSNYENINRITLLNGVYTAHETKSIINQMDFMISGRLHGCVAALTSYIPTLMISYNNGPPSHKLEGFSKFIDLEHYISKPISKDMETTWKCLFENSENIRNTLKKNIPITKKLALENFEIFF